MFLLDENLFKHWRAGVVDKEEVLLKAQKPVELATKIGQAERGIFEEEVEDEYEDEEEDQEEEEDEEEEEEDQPKKRR